MQEHISDATKKGAVVRTGGLPHDPDGTFFQPTIVTGVKQSGLGREGSHHGMEDYLEMKYICVSV